MQIKRPLMVFCILVIILCIFKNLTEFHAFQQRKLPDEAVTLQGRLDAWEIGNGHTILFLSDVFFYGDSTEEIAKYNSIGIRCYVNESSELKLGQSVAVRGFLSLPETTGNPGGFDSISYYRSRGYEYVLYEGELLATGETYDVILQGLWNVRQYAAKQLQRFLPVRDAGIMTAMLLGDKSDIDTETKDLYRSTGIYHILAISGLHISMIGGFVYQLLKKMHVNVWVATMLSLLFIVLYGIMIELPPSTFRAIVMYGFGIIAPSVLRSHDKLTSMAVAVACLAIAEPMLLFDAGVQLSFLAVLGIVVLYPSFLDIHKHHMKVADGVWVSFAVTYMTLPVIMKSYCEIPLYSLLVNVCVLPIVPLLLGLGLGIIILGPCLPVLAILFAEAVHIVLVFYEKFLSFVARLPGSSYITGAPDDVRIWMFYIVLGSLIWFVLKSKRRLLIRSLAAENDYAEGRQRECVYEQQKIQNAMRRIRCVQTAVMLLLLVLLLIPKRFEGRITFLDVGQGDGFCVELGREVFLIDGGSTSEDNVGKYILLPFLKHHGIDNVDGWFLTHPDKDHTSGFVELCEREAMGGITVDTLYIPAVLEQEFDSIIQLAGQKEIEVVLLSAGDTVQTPKGKWNVLSPSQQGLYEDENAASLVLYLENDDWDGLFMGDAGMLAEEKIMETDIKDVLLLKVGHHGSAVNANSEQFIQTVNPQLAVISCGENNVYGHPHQDVVERLETGGSRIWITASDGALTVTFDGGIRMSGQ